MANTSVKPVPDGMTTVTPHLVCAGAAAAIEFYKTAFGAVDLGQLKSPDGKVMHAAIRIGDAHVFLVDEAPAYGMLGPKALKGSPVTIHLFVPDVDGTVARAVATGARVLMPVADMFWGDRYGKIEDPFGHHWSVATRKQELSSEEVQQAAAKVFIAPP
jgi:uncharacterized glyoxalase superfamily protein PhnB